MTRRATTSHRGDLLVVTAAAEVLATRKHLSNEADNTTSKFVK